MESPAHPLMHNLGHQACQPPFTVSYGHNDRSVLPTGHGFTVGIAP